MAPHNSSAGLVASNSKQATDDPSEWASATFPPDAHGCPSLSNGPSFDSGGFHPERSLVPVQENTITKPAQLIRESREVNNQQYCNTNTNIPSISASSGSNPEMPEWYQDVDENWLSHWQGFETDLINTDGQDAFFWDIHPNVDLGPSTIEYLDDNTITTWLDAEVKATNPPNYCLITSEYEKH